jgi:hypothetical protein
MLLIHELIHQLLCTGQQPGARAQLVVALSSAEFCCLEALLTSTGRTFNDVSVTDTGDNEVQVLGGGGSPPRITVRELDDNAAALQLDPSWSTSLQDAYVDSVLKLCQESSCALDPGLSHGLLYLGWYAPSLSGAAAYAAAPQHGVLAEQALPGAAAAAAPLLLAVGRVPRMVCIVHVPHAQSLSHC